MLNPSLRKYVSLIATEIHGMTLLLYFEAFSLFVHELLTTLLRQTKNCQQATNNLLLIGANVTKAAGQMRRCFRRLCFALNSVEEREIGKLASLTVFKL